MLQAEELPAGIPKLNAGLADVYADDFPHCITCTGRDCWLSVETRILQATIMTQDCYHQVVAARGKTAACSSYLP